MSPGVGTDGRVALYVPGSRPDRFDKAADTGATVILDLEDSVTAADRPAAREAVAAWLATAPASTPVQVRVNAPGSNDLALDLAALPTDVDLRVPKVAGPEDLAPLAGRRVHALLETALGVERAFAVASAPEVVSLALGEADLAAELGLGSDEGYAWVRSRVVVAARAAGLPAPLMAAYPDLSDLDGLAESCRRGRALGFGGRTAVHPMQVPVIRRAFVPSEEQMSWAREVLARLTDAGVGTLADGSMVDAAMARRALAVLEEASRPEP